MQVTLTDRMYYFMGFRACGNEEPNERPNPRLISTSFHPDVDQPSITATHMLTQVISKLTYFQMMNQQILHNIQHTWP